MLVLKGDGVVRMDEGWVHYGTKPGHFETSKIHFPTSEGVSEVSERANKRTDERVTQYIRLYS